MTTDSGKSQSWSIDLFTWLIMQSGSITSIQPDQENGLHPWVLCLPQPHKHTSLFWDYWVHVFIKFEYLNKFTKFSCFFNDLSYLDVVRRAWGEDSEQGLRDFQVLSHLCEGRIRVGTHLLVPAGRVIKMISWLTICRCLYTCWYIGIYVAVYIKE